MPAADARPVPRKNVAWRLYLAIRKNDGTLVTGWTGADTEVALDGGTYVDATNELTEIGTSGTGFIDFTAAEMNADAVLIKATVTNSGALPLTLTVYPEEIGDYRSNVEQWGGTAVATAIVNASLEKILGTAVTEGTAGRLAARLSSFLDVATANLTLNSANQTGDAYGIVNSGTHGNAALKALLDAIDDFIDTEVAAIKAKTDNLPASPANESTLNTISSKLGSPVGASMSVDIAAVKADTNTIVTRITSTLFSGITSLKNWLGALAGKTPDTTTRAEINATTAGANYNETTDSQEAIRDRGDAAWVTGGGGGGTTIEIIGPIPSRIGAGEVTEGEFTIYTDADGTKTFPIYDDAGAAVSLSGRNATFTLEHAMGGADLFTKAATVTGASNNIWSVAWDAVDVPEAAAGEFLYSIRDDSDNFVWAHGRVHLKYVAIED